MTEQETNELLELAKDIVNLADHWPGMRLEDSGTIRALRNFLKEKT